MTPSSVDRPTAALGPLAGRSVVATGTSRGIGLAVARACAAAGASVVVNGRAADVVAEAVRAVDEAGRAAGGRGLGVVGSAADEDVVAEAVSTAQGAGEVSGLVCCAGVAEPPGSSILDVQPADWHRLIHSHLTSTFLACRAVAPLLVDRGAGSIVLTTSHAWTGVYGGTGYAAAKGATVSLTYALAAELRERGVRVNAVSPGATTRLSSGAEYEQTITRLHARGLLDDLALAGARDPGSPEHAAATYLYLLDDVSSGVSGEVLTAAGGYVGRLAPPTEALLTWRDHHVNGPWSQEELDAVVRPAITGEPPADDR